MTSLDLGLIGNGTIGALVTERGDFVWACVPRFDGDPAFCSLLREPTGDNDFGFFSIELVGMVRSEQVYLENTPILITRLFDGTGAAIEIADFAPRFLQFGRMFCPMMIVRQIKRISGSPRIRIRMRPAREYGHRAAPVTNGSRHIRYECTDVILRLTTDAPITSILEENPFVLEGAVTLLLGPDETIQGSVPEIGRRFFEETTSHWREWVRSLGIAFEWQEAVIRAAITLKLNAFEDTGAIIAAMTTSIPEDPASGRTWDYRFCWIRDSYFVVNALNRLGATETMERYIRYIVNLAASAEHATLQPVYGISGRIALDERIVDSLPGYRGLGPVRVGNQAYQQIQNDVYGSAVLAATHVFFDLRLIHRGDEALFHQLEALGEQAVFRYNQPDAGIWELRGTVRVHTFSSVMCWAACDRLARIAAHLGLDERAAYWQAAADRIHKFVTDNAWNEKLGSFVGTMGGDQHDASLLQLHDLGFLRADDPRFAGTVDAIARELRKGQFLFRYVEEDHVGAPQNAFLVCTFWYINALAALGRREEARELFGVVLACRNRHGLLAEHIDPNTREQWGNFVQTYSMVGLIDCATRLSIPWDDAF
ncbi:MAG: glycoside hydrolase family 15 protein [bacterium]